MASIDAAPSFENYNPVENIQTAALPEAEIPVNMPVYIIPHGFISTTIPTITPADTLHLLENHIPITSSAPLKGEEEFKAKDITLDIHNTIGTSEALKAKEDVKVKEITREYMDKVLEGKARVEHDEEAGGVDIGDIKSFYEELFELKWNFGARDHNLFIEEPRAARFAESVAFVEERDVRKKDNLERAALVEAAERQRDDAMRKAHRDKSKGKETELLSMEETEKIEEWKWVFYTGDKGGEIRSKVPVSPKGTPVKYS
jgi:hypothetical protein